MDVHQIGEGIHQAREGVTGLVLHHEADAVLGVEVVEEQLDREGIRPGWNRGVAKTDQTKVTTLFGEPEAELGRHRYQHDGVREVLQFIAHTQILVNVCVDSVVRARVLDRSFEGLPRMKALELDALFIFNIDVVSTGPGSSQDAVDSQHLLTEEGLCERGFKDLVCHAFCVEGCSVLFTMFIPHEDPLKVPGSPAVERVTVHIELGVDLVRGTHATRHGATLLVVTGELAVIAFVVGVLHLGTTVADLSFVRQSSERRRVRRALAFLSGGYQLRRRWLPLLLHLAMHMSHGGLASLGKGL